AMRTILWSGVLTQLCWWERAFAYGVACDAAMPHHAWLTHIPRHRAMHQASVIPDNGLARSPGVLIDARRAAREIDQFLQQLFRIVRVHTWDPVSVASDHERLAPGLWMDFDELPQRHGSVVKAVAVIVAAFFGNVPNPGLAVAERMVRGEELDP